jgi:hypothetical protein
MNAAVSRTLSLIPDRVPRVQSGSIFDPRASACPHPERIAHLAQFLSWLGPLNPITRDDLRILGFGTVFAKPALGGEEGEGERDLGAADDESPTSVEQPPTSLDAQPAPQQQHPETTLS